MEGLFGDISWGFGYSSEKFGLILVDDSYFGLSSTSPLVEVNHLWFSTFGKRRSVKGVV